MACVRQCEKKTFLKLVDKHFKEVGYNDSHFTLLKHFLKIFAAGLISGIGLGTDNDTTVIGSMLISPLSEPLTNFIYYLYSSDKKLYIHLYYFILDIILLFITGIIIGKSFEYLYIKYKKDETILKNYPNDTMYGRTGPVSIITSGIIACVAGILIFNSFFSQDLTYLIGIGIATSFLPPIVNSGMFFSIGENKLALSSFFIFLVSCVCMALSVMIMPLFFLKK